MFSIYELCGMLKELGLGDNNKIVFTHFRIPEMSLNDGLVPLMPDADVIKLLNYVPGCKDIEVYIETSVSLVELHLVELLISQSHNKGVGNGVVIKDIVKDNVVSSSGKDSRLFMLEWHGTSKEDVVSKSGKESRNDENVGNLNYVHDVSNEHENVDGVYEQIAGDIHDKLQTVDHAHDVDEEVVEGEENVVEEEEEGFVEDDKDSDFDWDEFGPDVIDMDELNSGDEGDDQAPQHRKRIVRNKKM
ncbi:hypothetical protein Tco_1564330 [Tanacetum coccineum]